MSSEEIYKGVILDHARHPRNGGKLEDPDFEAKAYNPLCGDELVLHLRLKQDLIEDCMGKVSFIKTPIYEDYVETDKETRSVASNLI